MAVKASRTQTIYKIPEVTALTPYYKVVAAGSTAPAKPSGTSPSGWSTTEPAFNSSNDLYMSIRTDYTYGDPEYSTPQKYATFEAAKVAYNEASAARIAASEAQENLDDYIASKNLIVGTHTAATRFWTGVSNIEELVDGTEIYFYTGYNTASTVAGDRTTGVQIRVNSSTTKAAGTQIVSFEENNSAGTASNVQNVWLNLTLKNGTQTGWIPCYWRGAERQTSHFPAGSSIRYVYRVNAKVGGEGTTAQYTGWWADASYDSGNERDNQIIYFSNKTGAEGVHRYALFMEDANGTFQSICTGDNKTDATHVKNPVGFKVNKTIYINWSNTNYGANTNITGWGVIYTSRSNPMDSRYSFNTKRTTTTTDSGYLTAYKSIYLVGTIDYDSDNADGLFHLDDVWWTQNPNQEGKIYVLVGACYDCNASNNRFVLYENNTWYRYSEKWGLVELQSANNQENRESYQSLSAEVATIKNTGNSLQYLVSSLKNGYFAYDQATGNFQSGKTYYEFYQASYVPLTWDSSTSKYIDHDGNAYSVGSAIPNGIYIQGEWTEGLDKVVNDYYAFQSTFVEQTNEAITTWFADTTIDGKNIEGNIDDIKRQLKSTQEMLDAYDSYIRQGIDKNPAPTLTSDTVYMPGKRYYSYNSTTGVYTELHPTIGATISGNVYESLHYGDAYIEIGHQSNSTMIRIYPDEVVFMTAGIRSAYLSNNTLYISESTILKKEQIGHWLTYQDDQNNLNTKWVN